MIGDYIDVDRIEARLDTLWEIGAVSDGGVTRLAYSEEESEAIEFVREELPAHLETRTDSVGNFFATPDPDADRSLYLGSHLDTVFNGGRLDGALGVIVALEAIEAIEAGDEATAIAPTLAVFRAEESARFGQHTIGSRAALGLLTVDDFAAVDQSDIPLWQAIQQAGYQPENLAEPTLDLESIAGYLEVHIEQGGVLEAGGHDVGLVTSIRAPVRERVTVLGDDDHSGATPMDLRRDAVAGAADMITAVEAVACAEAADGDVVATVGDVSVPGGSINKVSGVASFPIDLRSNDATYRAEVEEQLRAAVDAIADERDLELHREELDRTDPVTLDPDMTGFLAGIADGVDAAYHRLPSGGGHDAMNFQRVGIPTGLVFTPSLDGVSHNPDERTTRAGIQEAATIVAHAIAAYDGRAS